MPAILGSGLVLAAHSAPGGAGLSSWGPVWGSTGTREGGRSGAGRPLSLATGQEAAWHQVGRRRLLCQDMGADPWQPIPAQWCLSLDQTDLGLLSTRPSRGKGPLCASLRLRRPEGRGGAVQSLGLPDGGVARRQGREGAGTGPTGTRRDPKTPLSFR